MPHITSLNIALARSFHCSRILPSGGLFRARRRLPPSNNEWGPLTDRPDFSVIGKPDPRFTSEGQRKRAIKNYQFANDAIRLVSEIYETKAKSEAMKRDRDSFIQQTEKLCLTRKGSFSEPFKRLNEGTSD
ncbi:hypothetical protein CSKR_200703 [Clonorchis sinensis]|uniref:Large ribosomal subunit protein mL52 n=1 Tax=Clonorchis sinensis TaxID=79923 RepID=A0A8T1MFU0_CLOSI|nr:hypothetical protein CSKR_200703 [Clonorchis sinensis]